MKRIVVMMCAVALMAGAVSCKKDPKPEDEYVNPTYVEGVFNPGKHLSKVVGNDINEEWSWSNTDPQQLTGIADASSHTYYNFTYKGSGRMATSNINVDGTTITCSYEYDEGTLDRMTVRLNGNIAAEGTAGYAGGNISRIDYSNISGDLIWHFARSYASDFLGMDLSAADLEFTNPTLSDVFTWDEAQNVKQEFVTANISGEISISDLFTIAGDMLSDQLGAMGSLLLPLIVQNMGDSSFAFSVTGDVNVDYAYDNKYNPYRGLWYRGISFQPMSLSANNFTSVHAMGNLRFNVKISLPEECPAFLSDYAAYWSMIYLMVNGQTFGQDIPIDETLTRTYQYNAIGFPTSYTDQDGKTVTLTYKD